MKKILLSLCLLAVAILCIAWFAKDDNMTRQGNTYVITTEHIGKKVSGYAGPTPVIVYIEKDKIVKIETPRNQESPQYFRKAKTLLQKYEGKRVDKAREMQVDGVTGATYSSRSLIRNVNLALEYYQKHK